MEDKGDIMLHILNKKYIVMYKNEYDQVGLVEGVLLHPDFNGFTVFEVNNKIMIFPKERVFSLREPETPVAAQNVTSSQKATGDQ